ncbi:LAFE_0H03246g1_1 [Lachancea fermentati]|uniref:LAFE_0H03246g1_1 n=1 Tax=Lachancea fermentati TaxID=4955 RepID=A0A1G4MJQ0_LACFM|nr:LAFE_0H03246g1_1 [Lachancea fermentati]
MEQQSNRYEYVKSPSVLPHLHDNLECVTFNIEFVSVLTAIDFKPSSRCLLRFNNFENGKEDAIPYACKIKCDTPETLNLTKMTLSLLSQPFDLDIPCVDSPSGFMMTHLYLERLCLAHVKGKFTRNNKKGSILLQGIRPIDLQGVFSAKPSKQSNDHSSIIRIFDNLIKLNNDSKAEFKFVKLVNYDTKMKQFVQAREEKIRLQTNMRNPIFGAAAHILTVESQNDFDSQDVDTQPSYQDSIETFEHLDSQQLPNQTIVILNSSSGKSFNNDSITESEETCSQICDSSILGSLESSGKPSEPTPSTVRQNTGRTRESNYVPLTNLRGLNDRNSALEKVPTRQTCPDFVFESSDDELSPEVITSLATSSVTYTQHTDGSLSHEESVTPSPKRRKIPESAKLPDCPAEYSLALASSDELYHKRGVLMGMVSDSTLGGQHGLRLFFKACEEGGPQNVDKIINPHTNCVEIQVVDEKKLLASLLASFKTNSSNYLNDLQAYVEQNGLVDIRVKKHPFLFSRGYFSFSWALHSITLIDERLCSTIAVPEFPQIVVSQDSQASQESKTSNTSSQQFDDPIKKFEQLSIKAYGDVEFVRVFALLVAAKRRNGNMRKFVFTDFTSHPLNKVSCFDSFIGSYRDRVSQDKAFMFIMYDDVFLKFSRALRSAIGCDFSELFTGSDHNLTHRGIVCEVVLKAKMYNGSIDGTVRSCVPVKAQNNLRGEEKRALTSFYQTAIQRIPQYHLAEFFDNFSLFFPLRMERNTVALDFFQLGSHKQAQSPSVHGKHRRSTETSSDKLNLAACPPSPLNLEATEFQIVKDIDIPSLHMIGKAAPHVLYDVRGKVVAMSLKGRQLAIHITNDCISQDLLDPSRILRIDIIGPENLSYFFSVRDYHAKYNEFDSFIGHEFSFKLSRTAVSINTSAKLLTWTPIECTLEEMRSQLRFHNPGPNAIKIEQTDTIF